MKFLIITHVQHKLTENGLSAYSPYVKEMNIWLKHVDEVTIIAPKSLELKKTIDSYYKHDYISFKEIPSIEFTSIKKVLSSILKIPLIINVIFNACRTTDHIHLRCPGNIGLLGCLIQVLFPKKNKTAKYAGNWDPKAKQPLSYNVQKWLLSNTFLTKNITTLVYGDWNNQTKNIKSFFTASYNNSEKELLKVRDYSQILKFVFIGSLVEGKQPLFAIKVVELLNKQRRNVSLDIYGEGTLKPMLKNYISDNKLESKVTLLGNRRQNVIKEALKSAHFSILPSKSEGWPKAIAEAMFFGVIPIATSISCVPFMLDYGKRGILIETDLNLAIININTYLNDSDNLKLMSANALKWSQTYNLDVFETEIIKLLKN